MTKGARALSGTSKKRARARARAWKRKRKKMRDYGAMLLGRRFHVKEVDW